MQLRVSLRRFDFFNFVISVIVGAGYEHPVDQVVEDLLSCLDDPALALLQWKEAFGVVQARAPPCKALIIVLLVPCPSHLLCNLSSKSLSSWAQLRPVPADSAARGAGTGAGGHRSRV